METPTLPFLIEYKNGKRKTIDAENHQSLITEVFGSQENFKKKVHRISWKIKSTVCVLYAEDGRIERKIADGDVNPYSWRLQHH
jgi:hypothetical protein